MGTVPGVLPRNRAAVPSEPASDRSSTEAFLSQRRDGVSFLFGDLAILHMQFPVLGGVESCEVFQVTFLFAGAVALTI
jgi:hypothetical protein